MVSIQYSSPASPVGHADPGTAAPARTAGQTAAGSAAAPGRQRITLKVNGTEHTLDVEPNVILLDALREILGLHGTKKGCDHGQCGACTVHINGRSMNSCLLLAVMQQNVEITTIEGLAQSAGFEQGQHPVQQAFLEHDAYQCGYCTAGQMMTAAAVINEGNVEGDDVSLREAMSGNICRCGAYKNILEAVQSARARMTGEG
ncbi:xanthine dehydrogenase YagT iron-sulfur-binding subunit [Kushneria sinocarnis]|uniref:Xanthine dehydrogenase YagT iron-sulfur-binding subunit n=1 Tax=Kushneria sinocarnis TaxID=595502 RepID=A0A420WU47_9GAMM|nr:(2Fe-2S)-binding protein [Kushneria sinocarnis]RKQ96964.1 xanthine dehydrogenase YagT iron-sulfur-binding subunit [Kushneria sinocarnis]